MNTVDHFDHYFYDGCAKTKTNGIVIRLKRMRTTHVVAVDKSQVFKQRCTDPGCTGNWHLKAIDIDNPKLTLVFHDVHCIPQILFLSMVNNKVKDGKALQPGKE